MLSLDQTFTVHSNLVSYIPDVERTCICIYCHLVLVLPRTQGDKKKVVFGNALSSFSIHVRQRYIGYVNFVKCLFQVIRIPQSTSGLVDTKLLEEELQVSYLLILAKLWYFFISPSPPIAFVTEEAILKCLKQFLHNISVTVGCILELVESSLLTNPS